MKKIHFHEEQWHDEQSLSLVSGRPKQPTSKRQWVFSIYSPGLPEKQTSIHFSHVSLWLWGILGLFHLRTFHLLLPALAVYCTHWVVSRVAHHNRCMPQPQFFSNANILKTRPSKSAHKHVLWTEKVHNKSSVYSHGSRENCHHISYCSRLRLAKHVTQSFLGTN